MPGVDERPVSPGGPRSQRQPQRCELGQGHCRAGSGGTPGEMLAVRGGPDSSACQAEAGWGLRRRGLVPLREAVGLCPRGEPRLPAAAGSHEFVGRFWLLLLTEKPV